MRASLRERCGTKYDTCRTGIEKYSYYGAVKYTDAQPAGTAYGLVYPRATQGTLLSHTPVRDPQTRISIHIHHGMKPV
jgi:hypothetical protein